MSLAYRRWIKLTLSVASELVATGTIFAVSQLEMQKKLSCTVC